MQVQAINTQNNQTSFGAIFYPKNIKFNKVQEPIAETIKNALREPLQIFKGETAEGFYESKGYDFSIEPYFSNSVSLTAYKGMKEIGTGVNRRYTYLDRVYIGEYDKNSEFRFSDIETSMKDKLKSDLGFVAVALTAITSLLLISALSIKEKFYGTTKPLIENVDSVANKAKAVKPILEDSFKLGKNIIKK